MTGDRLTSPALLTYVYWLTDGPQQADARHDLSRLWDGLAGRWRISDAIPRLFVPARPPTKPGSSSLLCAAERRGQGIWQAVLWAEHDVWCLAVMAAPAGGSECGGGWRRLERQWSALDEPAARRLGQVSVLLGLHTLDAPDRLVAAARSAVPPPSRVGWAHRHDLLELPGNSALPIWEVGPTSDPTRPTRRLLALAPVEHESAADDLLWTTGDGTLAPLGRHLLHAAKLRHQRGVHDQGRPVAAAREALDRALATHGPGRSEALIDGETVHRRLTVMGEAVTATADNLRSAFLLADADAPDGRNRTRLGDGPLSDDLQLATWLTTTINEELAGLGRDLTSARTAVTVQPHPPIPPSAPGGVLVLAGGEHSYRAVRAPLIDIAHRAHPAGTLFELGTLTGSRHHVTLLFTNQDGAGAGVLTERAIALFSPAVALSVGVAASTASTADALPRGHVLVGTKVYYSPGGVDERDAFRARPRVWDASHRLEQLARQVARTPPWADHVHFGPLATGAAVLGATDGPLARQLHDHYEDAVAVDLYGAGIAEAAHLNDALPTLAIRGISERVGHPSDDPTRTRRLAADAAARFAADLCRALT